MQTRTTLQLSKAVMEKLGVIDALEDPAAEDHAMIERRYEELMEGLRFENIAYWPNDEIPLLVFPALADLVALHSQSAFGIPTDVTAIEAAEVPIKRRIKKYTAIPVSGDEIYQRDF